MKISISMADELVSEIDRFAEQNYLSRSGAISMATRQFVQSQKLVYAMAEMNVLLRRIADNNEIDDEAKNELANIEYMLKMFSALK